MTHKSIRKSMSVIALVACSLAALAGLIFLVAILYDVTVNGIKAMNFDLFLKDPVPAGVEGGGLRNAFVGHLMLLMTAIFIGVPIGILGGTFLAEYARGKTYARVIGSLADILTSVPSIIIGTFVYAFMVKPLGHFSGWAGAVALAIIMIPVIMKTTENMLTLVPWSLREAAFALGAPYYKVIISVLYRGAAKGILTGVVLSIARVAGETAPLLFTAFNNSFFTTKMSEPMPSLTVAVYQYAMGPYDNWHSQAWAASLVITLFVLVFTLLGKLALKGRG